MSGTAALIRLLVHVPHPTLSTAMLETYWDKPNMAEMEKETHRNKTKAGRNSRENSSGFKRNDRGAEVSGRAGEERAAGMPCVPQALPACFPLEAAKSWEHM